MKRIILKLILIGLIPAIVYIYFLGVLPEEIAIHFNTNGKEGNYVNKIFIPILSIFSTTLCILLYLTVPNIDPKKRIMFDNKSYQAVWLILVSYFTIIWLLILLNSIYYIVILRLLLSFTFLCIGALGVLLKYIPSNYFIGIRTPWTLESSNNWSKTHDFSSKYFIYFSLSFFALTFVVPNKNLSALMIWYLTFLILPVIAYSYYIYRKEDAT